MLKLENTKYLLLLIGLCPLVVPAAQAQEDEHVTLDVTATERDGSVHKLVFDARVHPRIAQVLAGTDQAFEPRWTPVELVISVPASGSRWRATAAEYQLPHGGRFEGWSGDTLRFEWAADAKKGAMRCQLSRPAKRSGGARGRFTGKCHDRRYSNQVLLTLTMDRPRAQRPGAPWPDRPHKPIPRPPSTAPLLIHWSSDLEPVWREGGNQAHNPVTFYRAVPRDGFCGVGHLAQDRQATRGKVLMVKENPHWNQRGTSQRYGQSNKQRALLAPPLDYIRVGWNRAAGPDQGWAIWQPVGALDYHCLGGVVTRGFDPPSRDEVVCLRNDLLTEGRIGDLIWEHRSPAGFQDLTLFESRSDNGHPLGTFLIQQKSRQYATPVARWVPRYDAVSEETAPHTQREKRFVDQADGTVLDSKTGLIWLRQTDCISERGAESAAKSVRSLRHGTCGLTDRSRVGDWRLPTRDEWLETQDRAERQGCRFPTLTDLSGSCLPRDQTPFSGDVLSARRTPKGSSSGVCWLSSTGTAGNPQVMLPGRGGWSDSHDPREEGCVWPVRVTRR